MINNKH